MSALFHQGGFPGAMGVAGMFARIMFHIPPEHRVWWGSLVAVAAAVVIVVGLILGWQVAMHFLGGWRSLAKFYRTADPLPEARVVAYGAVGWMATNHLAFAATEAGIFIQRVQCFDRLNKPLFIPWTDLHSPREGKSYTAARMVELSIGHPVRGKVLLPVHVLDNTAGHSCLSSLSPPVFTAQSV